MKVGFPRRDAGPTHFSSGDELCAFVRSQTDTVALAFSNGKDSIAAWLQLRRFFPRIVPYYRAAIPGLRFIEESLRYYEDFFETPILRYPDPTFFGQLEAGVFQTPTSWARVRKCVLPWQLTSDDIKEDARERAGGAHVFVAAGWRESDSLRRRLVLQKYGVLDWRDLSFQCIFDWTEKRLAVEFQKAGVSLPPDYVMFNRSFEAITFRYLEPLSRYYPDDVERIRFWFPLVDVHFARRRFYEEKRCAR